MSELTGVELWNERCMEMIDRCDEMDIMPQEEGRDTEALVGMQLAEELIALQASHEELVEALEGVAGPDEPQRFSDYELWSAWRLRVEKWKTAKAALANAAKLAPPN